MRVGLCQIEIVWEDKDASMKRVISYLEEAKEKGIDILFFPEMTLTGFSFNLDVAGDKKYGDTISRFSSVCKQLKIAAGFGWIEVIEGEKAKNHYSIVDDEGKVILDYVKMHPFTFGGEAEYFQGGTELQYCYYKGHKISTGVCYDLRFPELFRMMEKDVSLVVIPANWPETRSEHWKALTKARAIENQLYVAAVNCVGTMNGLTYTGDSTLYDPDGRELVRISSDEGIISYEIPNNIEEYREVMNAVADQKLKIGW